MIFEMRSMRLDSRKREEILMVLGQRQLTSAKAMLIEANHHQL